MRAYWSDYANTAGGESFSDLVERFQLFWRPYGEAKGRRWIVVAHTDRACGFVPSDGTAPSEGLRFAPAGDTYLVDLGGIWSSDSNTGERPRSMSFGAAGATHSGEARTQGAIRLALSGSAGTGKTTLGQSLAEHWGVPFIPEGMRARIEAGLQLHQLSRVELKELVLELWDERCRREDEALATVGGFVADRSPIDYLVFWLHYGFTNDEEGTQLLMDQVRQRSRGYDRIVVLPWGVLPLCSDGVRSSNPWLQLHFQAAVEGLLNREIGSPTVVELPPLDNLDARKRGSLTKYRKRACAHWGLYRFLELPGPCGGRKQPPGGCRSHDGKFILHGILHGQCGVFGLLRRDAMGSFGPANQCVRNLIDAIL